VVPGMHHDKLMGQTIACSKFLSSGKIETYVFIMRPGWDYHDSRLIDTGDAIPKAKKGLKQNCRNG
jgi:hypothetical protein